VIKEIVLKYFKDIENDENNRYKSWEHCFSHFQKSRNDFQSTEIDCLNLGFYLASWGMMRGSSFLLHKDYKIHKFAVDIIKSPKYKEIWEVDSRLYRPDDKFIDLIFNLKEDVRNAYIENIKIVNAKEKTINVTDTLASKILLGTNACAPAYDRYFIDGLAQCGMIKTGFTRKSYIQLIEFYLVNKKEIDEIQERISMKGLKYPVMKILDMYFWQLGYDNDVGLSKDRGIL